METQRMIIMRAGMTANGLLITEEAIKNSLDTFINKPIVFNEDSYLKDYTSREYLEKYNREHVIGSILGNLELKDGVLTSDVSIWDKSKFKEEFDNWCIEIDGGRDGFNNFNLCSIEIF